MYVAATRAREHLVLSLFHGASGIGANTPAAAIWRRLGEISEPRPRPIGDEELAAASKDLAAGERPAELIGLTPEEHLHQGTNVGRHPRRIGGVPWLGQGCQPEQPGP
jgi:hypothetical protein